MRIAIEATPEEIVRLVHGLDHRTYTVVEETSARQLAPAQRQLPPAQVDPQSLPAGDARRYQETGRVSDYGEREMIDVRTGRRGVYMPQMGMGFVKGAYVTSDGRVEFDHPSDNPFCGCSWS